MCHNRRKPQREAGENPESHSTLTVNTSLAILFPFPTFLLTIESSSISVQALMPCDLARQPVDDVPIC